MDNIKFYTKEYWAGYYDACRHLSSSTRMNKPQLEVIEELRHAVKGKLETLGVEFTESQTPLAMGTSEGLSIKPDGFFAKRLAKTSHPEINQLDETPEEKAKSQGFNPLGGASRGVGRCICAAGPGTNPACPVHP